MGRLLSWLSSLLLVLFFASAAWGQLSTTLPLRADCTTLTGPVANTTPCKDTTRGVLLGYDGIGWQSDVALATKIINAADPRFGMSPSATAAVNATALQAAIDAVPSDGGELCIPTGSYNINAAPTLKTRLTISGCSDVGVNTGQTTRLVYSGAGALFSITVPYVTLRNLRVDGTGIAGQKGFYVSAQSVRLYNVEATLFRGGGSYGIHAEGTNGSDRMVASNHWRGVQATNSTVGIVMEGTGGGSLNSNYLEDVYASANVGDGVTLGDRAQVLTIVGLRSESNATGGTGFNLNITGAATHNVRVYNGWLEGVTKAAGKGSLSFPADGLGAYNIEFHGYQDNVGPTNFAGSTSQSYFVSQPGIALPNTPAWTRLSANIIYGGPTAGETLELYSTDNATKGHIVIGSNTATETVHLANSNRSGTLNVGDLHALNARGVSFGETDGTGYAGRIHSLDTGVMTTGSVIALTPAGASGSAWRGIIHVVSTTNGQYAIYGINGAAGTTTEISDPSATFTTAAGGVSTNIYWSAGNSRYELQNNIGVDRTYSIFYMIRY